MSTSTARHERRIAQYQHRHRDLSREVEQLRGDLEKALGLLDESRARDEQYETLLGEFEQLHGAILEGSTRAAWEAEAKAAGVLPELLDDLWTIDPPEVTDEPDPAKLREHLAKTIAARPFAVAPKEAPADAETETDTDDDQAEGEAAADDDDADPFDSPSKPKWVDLAPKVKGVESPAPPAKPKAAPAPAPTPGKTAAKPPAPGLAKGPGAAKGGRDDHKPESLADYVERDFRESGRSDPFRI